MAVASSLTELFAPTIHKERISGMLENYDFIDEQGHGVLQAPPRRRPPATPISLSTTSSDHATTREEQDACVDAVRFKCNVLWVQLDALHHAYVAGNIPPGAFRPGGPKWVKR